jgi:integrase
MFLQQVDVNVLNPRAHYDEQNVLKIDQVRVFLQVCWRNQWEELFCLAVTTGMREGKLLGLKWRVIYRD